jgi:uncharacterized protein YutE (UPF0331/DUF86 family)
VKEFSPASIGNKLARMAIRVQRLSRYQNLTLDEYRQDEDTQLIVERLLEKIIQSALDINRAFLGRVIKLQSESLEKMSNTETFISASEHGLISKDLGQQIAKSGGFRNVLAHLYDDIIPDEVYRALRLTLQNYPQYILEVESYLTRTKIEND